MTPESYRVSWGLVPRNGPFVHVQNIVKDTANNAKDEAQIQVIPKELKWSSASTNTASRAPPFAPTLLLCSE